MSLPTVLPDPSLAPTQAEEASQHGTKRPREDQKEDDSSATSLHGALPENSVEGLALLAPVPKRPRASPSNQIHEAIFACPVPSCSTNYTRRSNLKNHLITKHADLHPRKTFAHVFQRKPKCKPGHRQSPPLLTKAAKCSREGCGKTFVDDRALAAHVAEAHQAQDDVMGAILGILRMKSPDLPTLPSHAHELLLPMEITPTYEDRLLDAMPQYRPPELPPLSFATTPSFPLPSFQPSVPIMTPNATPLPSTAPARFLSTFSPDLMMPMPIFRNAPQVHHTLVGLPAFFSNIPNDFVHPSQTTAQPQTSGFPSVSESPKF